MGYLLTEEYNLPHGIACAVFLPSFYQHIKNTTPALAEQFLEEIRCSEELFLRLIQRIIPEHTIALTEEKIQQEHARWIGNAAFAKTEAEVSADMADEILRSLI